MEMAKEHIEEIRRTKFSIGGEPNPLTEDLHQAVKNLSAELYAKDVHFLMELIQVYGSAGSLPTTTVVLPLKADKVKPVKQQLSSIHPEVLLFLTKIKRLSVKERNQDPRTNTVSAIAITSETNFVTRKNIDAESYTLHLSAEEKEKGSENECSYYMWKQKFPVRQENKVERRMDAEELSITLAFPIQERLHRGTSSPGLYAFLPTEMVTNFPFLIQADFLLASSRETILLDSKWNLGILACVPTAFINAFVSLVKDSENVPVFSLAPMLRFIPVNSSSYRELNSVRESIKAKLVEEDIIPSESYSQQKFFHKPREVGRLMPAFWNILGSARKQGVSLHNLSSHGKYILSSSFDKQEYDHILSFLGVEPVNDGWYAKCIQGSNLVSGVSEDVYLDILLFLADNWSKFDCTNIRNISLVKYVGLDGAAYLCSINECTKRNGDKTVSLSRYSRDETHKKLSACSQRRATLLQWLQDHVKVGVLDVYVYAVHLTNSINVDRKLAIAFVHFLYHSLVKDHLSKGNVDYLCGIMPLVDKYGKLSTQRKVVLVPASESKWVGLIGSNPWRGEGYVELGEEYLHPGHFAGLFTSAGQLLEFLKTHVAASDIPYVSPPNAAIPAVSAPLTSQNALLLLDWIQKLNYRRSCIPERFLNCIKEGSWLKITSNGCSGYRPPSRSFMLGSSLGNILQSGSVLVDIPIIDESFYGKK
ncbi:hypothetical protein CJ030_MR6G023567 [Morella rubra]|uniref:Uncharacterized protein n=1 Tax=Morella rubra TaxID=262757 RepID=A0A6A1VDU3_9ROSI|nr:hypothetical protein CJ030_MR6G023567 [Morella rubra]